LGHAPRDGICAERDASHDAHPLDRSDRGIDALLDVLRNLLRRSCGIPGGVVRATWELDGGLPELLEQEKRLVRDTRDVLCRAERGGHLPHATPERGCIGPRQLFGELLACEAYLALGRFHGAI